MNRSQFRYFKFFSIYSVALSLLLLTEHDSNANELENKKSEFNMTAAELGECIANVDKLQSELKNTSKIQYEVDQFKLTHIKYTREFNAGVEDFKRGYIVYQQQLVADTLEINQLNEWLESATTKLMNPRISSQEIQALKANYQFMRSKNNVCTGLSSEGTSDRLDDILFQQLIPLSRNYEKIVADLSHYKNLSRIAEFGNQHSKKLKEVVTNLKKIHTRQSLPETPYGPCDFLENFESSIAITELANHIRTVGQDIDMLQFKNLIEGIRKPDNVNRDRRVIYRTFIAIQAVFEHQISLGRSNDAKDTLNSAREVANIVLAPIIINKSLSGPEIDSLNIEFEEIYDKMLAISRTTLDDVTMLRGLSTKRARLLIGSLVNKQETINDSQSAKWEQILSFLERNAGLTLDSRPRIPQFKSTQEALSYDRYLASAEVMISDLNKGE